MILTALIFAHSRLSISRPRISQARQVAMKRGLERNGDAAQDEDKEQEDKEEPL